LFYFYVIAEEGGVAPAARKLRLTHSTLSAQLGALEAHFGAPLFERRGKRLVLTPFGTEAASFAADIFRLGRELNDVARGKVLAGREGLRLGVVPAIPKTLVHHLLSPALDGSSGPTLVRQDSATKLIDALAAGRLHLILTNEVPAEASGSRIHAHSLGETEVLLYGRGDLARAARRDFPRSLAGAPFVMPASGSPLRRRLDEWLAGHDLEVTVAAEVDDAGLLRTFGSAGRGIFPVRAALKAEVEDLRDVKLVGPCEGVRERYYAITTDRRIRDAALARVIDQARRELLAPTPLNPKARGEGS
jgi:LysR family transcriptional activator of nhaA